MTEEIHKDDNSSTSENNSENHLWNDRTENVIKELAEFAIAYKFMHITTAQNLRRTSNILSYIGIILGPLAGTLASINIELQDPLVFPIIIAIVAFISGIIASVIKYTKFEESITAHKSSAAKYSSLISNARRQLSLYRSKREHADKYLKWFSSCYDDIFSSSPILSSYIRSKYRHYAKKHNLKIIDEYEMSIEGVMSDFCNNNKIEINTSDDKPNNDDQTSSDENIKITIDPSSKIHKGNTSNAFADLNKYSDGKMRYEMSRLMGFK